jgi:cyanophycin synthetase
MFSPPYGNLADGLSKQALLSQDAPAIYLPGSTISFNQLETLVWKGALQLVANGIKAGQVIGLAFRQEINLIIALLASARIGATAISLPRALPTIIRSETARVANAVFQVTDLPDSSICGVVNIPFDIELLSRAAHTIDESVRVENPRAPWLIISGSGSTGKAKLIPVGHAQFCGRMQIYNTALAISPHDRWASLFSLDYATPKQRCLESLFAGAAIVLFDHAHGGFIQQIQQSRVSVLYATVLHAEKLLQSLPEDAHEVLSTLRCFMVGSSIVSQALRVRIQQRLTRNLYIYYGMNEIGLCALAPPGSCHSPGAVGIVPPGVRIEVVDSHGLPLPVGTIGHVRGQSPAMCEDYLGDSEAAALVFRDGWFYPGDLGKIAANGELVFCGRADDMMNMNGINIYPAEIERVLISHPAIRDATAFPLHHPIHQDIPICAVMFNASYSVSERELLRFAAQRLGARGPKRILALENIPRNEHGKVMRHQLIHEIGELLGSTRTRKHDAK